MVQVGPFKTLRKRDRNKILFVNFKLLFYLVVFVDFLNFNESDELNRIVFNHVIDAVAVITFNIISENEKREINTSENDDSERIENSLK